MRSIGVFLLLAAMGLAVPALAQVRPPAAPARPSTADLIAQGDKCMEAREYSKALQVFMTAWMDMPDNPAIFDRIGDVFMASGKPADATKFYAAAIKLNPGYEDPIISMAYAYLVLGKPDQAAALLDEPTRKAAFATSSRYQHALGMALTRMGRPADAIAPLKLASTLAPTTGYIHGDLGNAYYMAGKYADAVTAYAKALEVTPGDAQAALNLSMAQEKLGKYAEAAASVERYLTLTAAPDADPQHKRLATLKEKAGPA